MIMALFLEKCGRWISISVPRPEQPYLEWKDVDPSSFALCSLEGDRWCTDRSEWESVLVGWWAVEFVVGKIPLLYFERLEPGVLRILCYCSVKDGLCITCTTHKSRINSVLL